MKTEPRALVAGGGRRAASLLPGFVEPMKPMLVSAIPAGEWVHEVKFDGIRAMAQCHRRAVRLWSRTGREVTSEFPELVDSLASAGFDRALVDGEITALDAGGVTSFQLLQTRASASERPLLRYYAFDLLAEAGARLVGRPLEERRERLARRLAAASTEHLRFSVGFGGDPARVAARFRQAGAEGVVAKRAGSLYEPGRRSGAWVKLKFTREQEFIIGGYTEPKGGRRYLGSLLIGYHQEGRLRFAGKVGAGFAEEQLRLLYGKLRRLARTESPFGEKLPIPRTGIRWVAPELVCQVRFSEWTRDGRLRHPVFLGLRQDKAPAEVVRERPVA